MQATDVLQGAYASNRQLLALRFRPPTPAALTSRVFGQQSGIKVSRHKGRGVDFAEVRQYQPGDDVRNIDWRVTARKAVPHTKVFREERERPTLIFVDQTQNMFFGSTLRLKSVAAAEVAATMAWSALAANDRVGGLVVGNDTLHAHKPYRSVKTVARFIGAIASSNQALDRHGTVPEPATMADALDRLRRLARSNVRVLIISDFAGEADMWRDTVRALARRNDVSLLHIFDPLETELPPAEDYVVTSGGVRLRFNTGNRALRERYSGRFQRRLSHLKDICGPRDIRLLSIATSDRQLHTRTLQRHLL